MIETQVHKTTEEVVCVKMAEPIHGNVVMEVIRHKE